MTSPLDPLHWLLSAPIPPCIGCGSPAIVNDGQGVNLCDDCEAIVSRLIRGEEISESAGRSAVATAGAEVAPQPLAPAVAVSSHAKEPEADTRSSDTKSGRPATGSSRRDTSWNVSATSEFMDGTAGETASNSDAAKDGRGAPALVGVSSPDLAESASVGSALSFDDEVSALERAWLLQPGAGDLPLRSSGKLSECRKQKPTAEQGNPCRGEGEESFCNHISIGSHDAPVGSAPSDGADDLIKDFGIAGTARLLQFGIPGAVRPTERGATNATASRTLAAKASVSKSISLVKA
ncbi:hypothetical protein [Tardiphaga sp.]|uniref:hypothetical protein n=1 Tax=Tardiphaga sp. TaxID=1926292 RepID=UPI0026320A88|nr:hypothetical protein [Tardiphaga sp.]MDB5617061.1 hypothetical protein [Tardiphaga sp.]